LFHERERREEKRERAPAFLFSPHVSLVISSASLLSVSSFLERQRGKVEVKLESGERDEDEEEEDEARGREGDDDERGDDAVAEGDF
jgi:hypothetical protein